MQKTRNVRLGKAGKRPLMLGTHTHARTLEGLAPVWGPWRNRGASQVRKNLAGNGRNMQSWEAKRVERNGRHLMH